VGPLLIVFIGCIIFCAVGIYLWENKDKTAFEEFKQKFEVAVIERNAAIKKVDEFDKKLTEYGEGMEALANKITEIENAMKKSNGELEVFRDQVADTREKQYKLQSDLAKKQFKTDVNVKVDVPKGPFLVEIMGTRPRPKQNAPPTGDVPAGTTPDTPPRKGLGKGVKAIIMEQESKKKAAQGQETK
jgi:hypothetical protein